MGSPLHRSLQGAFPTGGWGVSLTHCGGVSPRWGVSPLCIRLCTSRWFLRLKRFPQVSQVNSRVPGGGRENEV